MLAIEKFFRTQFLIERLEQGESEIAVIAESINEAERAHWDHAASCLISACKALREAEASARVEIQPELLEAQLKSSLELIGRSPERLRRKGVGRE